jgi:hypothetical protein
MQPVKETARSLGLAYKREMNNSLTARLWCFQTAVMDTSHKVPLPCLGTGCTQQSEVISQRFPEERTT